MLGIEVKEMKQGKEKVKKEEFVAHPAVLAGLVDYQKGSVVSRTIIDEKAGTITLFAFDEGEGLSEHTAPFDAFVYLVDGEAEVIISGESMLLKEGEMVVMPANSPHALRAVKKFKMVLVMIRS